MAFLTALSLGGTIAGVVGSRKAAKEQKRLNRRALAVQEGSLAFAREQFELFRPAMQEISDFFSSVPLDDIISGKVLTPEARSRFAAFQEAAGDQERQLNASLAQRGISNDVAGAAVRGQFGLQQARQLSDIRNQSNLNALDQRLRFAQGGQSASIGVQQASQTLSGTLQRQAQIQGQAANQALGAAASGASTLAQLLNRSGSNNQIIDAQDQNLIEDNEQEAFRRPPSLLRAF